MRQQHVAVIAALAMVVGGVGAALAVGPMAGAGQSTPDGTTADQAQPAQQESGVCDYVSVFDRTIDSVVSIQTDAGQGSGFVYQVGENATANDTADATPNETPNESATATADAPPTEDANASYVVTNAHVVANAETIRVQFNGGEIATGEVVGASQYTDLAAVRVTETPGYVEALDVAAEDPPRGQAVAALGNPLGLDRTITHGIVSGLNRSMPTDRNFRIPNVIQTDAPINPGNSGGPLVTCDGTVVGVNTAGIATARTENIGFAVSASVMQNVVPSLLADGEFDYPFLGVSTQAVTPGVAEANDRNVSQGVMVARVLEGGPADGVLQQREDQRVVDGELVPIGGDVIVAVDGQPIATAEDLGSYLVTETAPGETVNVTVVRGGERTNVSVTLGERPDPGTT